MPGVFKKKVQPGPGRLGLFRPSASSRGPEPRWRLRRGLLMARSACLPESAGAVRADRGVDHSDSRFLAVLGLTSGTQGQQRCLLLRPLLAACRRACCLRPQRAFALCSPAVSLCVQIPWHQAGWTRVHLHGLILPQAHQ